MNLASIQVDLKGPNQLREYKNVKTQLKLICEHKRATKQKVKLLQEELKTITWHAKQSKKQGNKELAEAHLAEAFKLADRITALKRQILMQKKLIDEAL
jgi:phage shock protein A